MRAPVRRVMGYALIVLVGTCLALTIAFSSALHVRADDPTPTPTAEVTPEPSATIEPTPTLSPTPTLEPTPTLTPVDLAYVDAQAEQVFSGYDLTILVDPVVRLALIIFFVSLSLSVAYYFVQALVRAMTGDD